MQPLRIEKGQLIGAVKLTVSYSNSYYWCVVVWVCVYGVASGIVVTKLVYLAGDMEKPQLPFLLQTSAGVLRYNTNTRTHCTSLVCSGTRGMKCVQDSSITITWEVLARQRALINAMQCSVMQCNGLGVSTFCPDRLAVHDTKCRYYYYYHYCPPISPTQTQTQMHRCWFSGARLLS